MRAPPILRRCRQAATIAAKPDLVRELAGAALRGRLAAAARMAVTAARSPDLGAEKIISRKFRYIWLCVPKAASRSIMAALQEITPDHEIVTGTSAAELFAQRPEARDYYSFAFVRSPYTRALSFYADLHFAHLRYSGAAARRRKKERSIRFFKRFYGLAETGSFDDFCRWLNTPWASDAVADRHFLSQYLQIRLDGGRRPDFVGRFEHLDADFRRVAERLGLPAPALPLLHTMAGWRTTPAALQAARAALGAQLTERNKALLRTRYARDFELEEHALV